jgi:hypothetical protein
MPLSNTGIDRFLSQNYYSKSQLNAGQLDSLYFGEDEFVSTSAGSGDAGKPIKTNGSGIVDDTFLTNVPLLGGRASGQILNGGNAANEDIIINGTAHATKTSSYVLLQPTGGSVAVGTITPVTQFHMVSASSAGRSGLMVQSPTPNLTLYEDDAAADNRYWDLIATSESLALRTVNDANSVAVNILAVDRTGTTVDSVTIGGTTVNVTNTLQQGGVAVVTTTGTQTLSNKTISSPIIASIVNTGTLTLPTSTDVLVGRNTTDTLTNKTLTTPTISSTGFTNAQHAHTGASSGGQLDHGAALTGLADDDHTQYALLAGRSGGSVLNGGTGAGDDIVIHGTSNATRTNSYVILQPSGGNTVVGGLTTDHRFEVQDAGASNYRFTFNLNVSGVNYFNSYSTGVGTLTAAPLTIVSSALGTTGDSFRIETSKSPLSGGTGSAGQIAWDTSYLYVCTATNTWKRVALTGGY